MSTGTGGAIGSPGVTAHAQSGVGSQDVLELRLGKVRGHEGPRGLRTFRVEETNKWWMNELDTGRSKEESDSIREKIICRDSREETKKGVWGGY